jgi:hypothetical protein
MIIFTCNTNLQCMCDVDDIFIDVLDQDEAYNL